MSRKMRGKSIALALAVGTAVSVGASGAAFAGSHGATTTGSKAYSYGTTIYNRDTVADGDWTRSNWNAPTGSGGISNQSGYNTTVSKGTGHDITAVQACRSRNALPMVCSSWNSDY